MKTVGFFFEKEGVKSMVRLKTFLALIIALFAVVYSLITRTTSESLWIIISLLAYSGGEKVSQKFLEIKAK